MLTKSKFQNKDKSEVFKLLNYDYTERETIFG